MLPKNDQISGIDLERTFARMLAQLSWKSVKNCILANQDLHKLCTIGGYRLEPKKRKRFERVILEQAKKNEFSPLFCNLFFSEWYAGQGALYERLEQYFHSDEYKSFREEKKIEEGAYQLPDEKFKELFQPADLDKWVVLLGFSPLEFTKEQAEKILGQDAEGAADLVERVERLEQEIENLRSENARLQNEAATLRTRQEQAAAELKELRAERRNLQKEREKLAAAAENAQQAGRRLRTEFQEREQKWLERERELTEELERTTRRLKGDYQRIEQTVDLWKSRYEQQCDITRKLEARIEELEAALGQADARIAEYTAKIKDIEDFASLILSKIDWTDVGRQLKLTGNLGRMFNSLVRKLNYEEDRTLTIDGTLSEFWNPLIAREKALIHSVARSNTLEVKSGSIEEYWNSLTDAFQDVQIGLEARVILLRVLHEIFYQVLEMDDLKTPRIASIVAKKNKRS